MNTCIITTAYLDDALNYQKTIKFINYYLNKTSYDIIVFDNNSSSDTLNKISQLYRSPFSRIIIKSFSLHYNRPSHLDYKYLWRAVYHLKDHFNNYNKILYADNDFYILSDKMFKYVEDLSNGWTTFYCNMHHFPETGCHILLKDCSEYNSFISKSEEEFINEWNGRCMESFLPVTHIERSFVGDRYGENSLPITQEMDYYAQCPLEINI